MSRVDKEYAEKTTYQAAVPVIQRLDETLVNRIAAGEIIHRPASALKELIENALDAGATSIKVAAKEGGMKLLQIQDNGCGIRKSDLPILCERFTTSKLRQFSDLNDIATYGFRGEALASISFVSHLSVVTKTRDDACAWRSLYEDGVLIAPKEGALAEPVACAGNDGTVITAEDIFYNTPVRKSSLRNFNEEYTKLSEVVTRYAVHQAGVAFVCRKVGSPTPDVSTPAGASRTALIRLLFGAAVADALLETNTSSSGISTTATGKRKRPRTGTDEMEEEVWSESDDEAVPLAKRKDKTQWKAEAVFTNTSYQGKKLALLLFINHRLVESRRIQRAIETVYTATLPKGAHPFIYLSLEVDPKHVDVNVHPTKREVHFMNEDIIVEAIADAIQAKLAAQSSQRTFTYQTLTPVGDLSGTTRFSKTREAPAAKGKTKTTQVESSDDEPEGQGARKGSIPSTPATRQSQKALPQHLVRTSLRDRTLDSMFAVSSGNSSPTPTSRIMQRSSSGTAPGGESSSPARLGLSNPVTSTPESSQPQADISLTPEGGLDEDEVLRDSVANMVMNDKNENDEPLPPTLTEIPGSECFLTSVLELRKEIQAEKHNRLTEIFGGSKFVGIVDFEVTRSLIQHELKLYLVNHSAVAEELFYQLGLRQFGNFDILKLSPAPPLAELVHLAVSENLDIAEAGLDPVKIGDKIIRLLLSRREMLEEYFCIAINSEGLVEQLPMLLPGYTPNIDMLPVFLMHLGPRVDWKSERGCFSTIFREIARFYVPSPPIDVQSLEGDNPEKEERRVQITQEISWQNKHILFPAIQRYLVAPKRLLEKDVAQIANLPDLYRVFERC